jgi:hypothetical protein
MLIIIKNNAGTELEIQDGSHVAVDGLDADTFKEWDELDLGVRSEIVAIQEQVEGLVEKVKGLLG